MKREDEFVWMKIMPGVDLPKYNPYQITQEYQRAEYLLVHNWPPFVMSSETGWGLQSITKDTEDNVGRPAIGFRFDQDGGDRFYYLTSANTNQALAIIVEGVVVSAPHIAEAVGSYGMITGSFTAEQLDDMSKTLGKIVQPVSSTAVPVTRKEVGIYLIPVLIFVVVVSIVGFLVYR
jgi:preprotein translocase subunit SecD